MKNLKITIVQTGLKWENPAANLEHIRGILAQVKRSQTDLIILPEMFTSGFTMNVNKIAESMNGVTAAFMKSLAIEKNSVVCGSVVIKEKNKFFNRLLWVHPNKDLEYYDKRHLFRMAKEQKTYSAGEKRLLIDLKGWKICPLICYDLRFPVWSRSRGEIDLLLYVANWPSKRSFAWKQLLIARAIENQCYVAGVNRVGLDGNGIEYSGDSVALDPLGGKFSSIKANQSAVETITLDYKNLKDFRKQFPVMKDADDFRILKKKE